MLPFAVTIFTGAFLLFQVQPLIAKFILPWFGGTPGVWTTCMLFFQVLLVGGYAYAHFTSKHLKPRAQGILHLVLLGASLAFLPITPGDSWKPHDPSNPAGRILWLLTVCLGLPYFVLSSTGPLMQQWFSRTHPGVSPYRLYALSNVGSLLALVSYPFFFEPEFTRPTQAFLWGCGLVVFVISCGWCAVKLIRHQPAKDRPAEEAEGAADAAAAESPSMGRMMLWLMLPASASALLLAVTNKLCQDVAVSPFLWVLPLSLYLLTFIICFDSPRWYSRWFFSAAALLGMMAISWAVYRGTNITIQAQLYSYTLGLFVCCMFCHGELYRLKPHPRFLTGYFLIISVGGALGGMFVALVAPLVFNNFYEIHWSLAACAILLATAALGDREFLTLKNRRLTAWTFVALAILGFGIGLWLNTSEFGALLKRTAQDPVPSILSGNESLKSLYKHAQAAIPKTFTFFDEQESTTLAVLIFVFVGLTLLRVKSGLRILILIFMARAGYLLLGVIATMKSGADSGVKGLLHYLGKFDFIQQPVVIHFILWGVAAVGLYAVGRRLLIMRTGSIMTIGAAGLCASLMFQAFSGEKEIVSVSRNFYGVLTVYEYGKDTRAEHYYLLQHGRITHGLQLANPADARTITTYYGEKSGVRLGWNALPSNRPRKLGVVGLGTGTLSCYGRAGDTVRIYDINPAVVQLATSRFTFLTNCLANLELRMGDARLSMENDPPQNFDLLALDAFSSDAIPVHLLTREAVAIYLKNLKPDGILAVHISNRYLDLNPVVMRLAKEFKLNAAEISDDDETDWFIYSSTWILLSRSNTILQDGAISEVATLEDKRPRFMPLWTDDYASLLPILK